METDSRSTPGLRWSANALGRPAPCFGRAFALTLMLIRKDTFEVDSDLRLIGTQPLLGPLCLWTQALDRQPELRRVIRNSQMNCLVLVTRSSRSMMVPEGRSRAATMLFSKIAFIGGRPGGAPGELILADLIRGQGGGPRGAAEERGEMGDPAAGGAL